MKMAFYFPIRKIILLMSRSFYFHVYVDEADFMSSAGVNKNEQKKLAKSKQNPSRIMSWLLHNSISE